MYRAVVKRAPFFNCMGGKRVKGSDLGPEPTRIKLCRVAPRGQWKCRAGETEEDFPTLCEDEMTELLSQKQKLN